MRGRWQEIIEIHACDNFIFNMSRTNVVSIRFLIRRNVADSLFQVFHDVLKHNCVNEHIAASIFIEKHSLLRCREHVQITFLNFSQKLNLWDPKCAHTTYINIHLLLILVCV